MSSIVRHWAKVCHCVIGALGLCGSVPISPAAAEAPPGIVTLVNPAALDQDDVCIWRDSDDPARSLAITSDKAAGRIFVYDLNGRLLQQLSVPKPGNIDIRQQVRLGRRCWDLVAVNQRADEPCLRFFQVDHATRRLVPLSGQISTGANYGGCLFHDRAARRLYFIATAADGHCRQFEILTDRPAGVTGRLVREWQIGKCEGAAAIDERGALFITEEQRGIWRLGARPDDATPGKLISLVGQHGLTGDLEGIAAAKKRNLLVASDQGRGKFVVFDLSGEGRYMGEFSVPGVNETDGVEIVDAPLGESFPEGLFACHNGAVKPCPILLVPLGEALLQVRRDR